MATTAPPLAKRDDRAFGWSAVRVVTAGTAIAPPHPTGASSTAAAVTPNRPSRPPLLRPARWGPAPAWCVHAGQAGRGPLTSHRRGTWTAARRRPLPPRGWRD